MKNLKYLLVFALGCSVILPDSGEQEAAARNWGEKMGYTVTGASCADYDSDKDNYVSCSLAVEGKDPIALDCGYLFTKGCKLQLAAKPLNRFN